MMQNFRRDKKRVEETKKKRREEKNQKRLEKKLEGHPDANMPAAGQPIVPPVNPPLA